MISRACYVKCDGCGDPADVACWLGASEARELARGEGYIRLDGKDLCPRCAQQASSKEES